MKIETTGAGYKHVTRDPCAYKQCNVRAYVADDQTLGFLTFVRWMEGAVDAQGKIWLYKCVEVGALKTFDCFCLQ